MSPNEQPHVIADARHIPLNQGQIETADFRITGNLRAAYDHLKDMYEPKKETKSGPIKPLSKLELDREKHKSEGQFLEDLPLSNF